MSNVLFSSEKNYWETPKVLFETLDREFNFTLDACASSNNAKCSYYYSESDSIFNHQPVDESIFVNPPYSRNMGKFVKWCADNYKNNKVIVLLVPARTDTKWFHDFVLPYAEIRFIKGRVRFEIGGKVYGCSTFPSILCIYRS